MRIYIIAKSLEYSTDEDSTTVYVDGQNGNLYCMDMVGDNHETRAKELIDIIKLLSTIDVDCGWKKL